MFGKQPALKKKSTLRPLLHLLPFLFSSLIQIVWLSHPQYNDSYIIKSAALYRFCVLGVYSLRIRLGR